MSGIMFNASLPDEVRDAFAVLRAGAEAGRLAHGYVISSSRADWGVRLAVLMIQWLQCRESERPCGRCRSCLQIEAHTHADVTWVEPESKSRVIKIEQIRDLNHVLMQKSFEGGWKAAVIVHADRLNDNSANAFLKTLEEPPPNCLLLLVTENPQELLPTILSRCQRILIGDGAGKSALSKIEQAMVQWLRTRGQAAAPAEQGAWINAILTEVRDRVETEEKERAKAADEEIDDDLLKARIATRAIEARMEILKVLYRWERDVLVMALTGKAEALQYPAEAEALREQGGGRSPAALMERLQQVEQAVRLLDGNVPEASVWEAVLPV